MEHKEATQQGQVSAPGESPKDEEQNTDIDQIIQILKSWPKERVAFLAESLKEQAEPEGSETQEQEQPAEPTISEQTMERLKSFYKNLDPRTKLAILTLSEIQCLDGINFQISKKEGKLYDEIWDDMQSVCMETFHKEPDDVADIAFGAMTSEDVWLCGVWEAVRMVTQNC